MPGLALAAALLCGCAALAGEPTSAAAPDGPRYIAELRAEPADAAALQARLQAVARVAVLRPVVLAPLRWAFTLRCDGPAACEAAAQRLRADAGLLKSLEPDPLVKVPQRPRGESAR